MDLLKVGTTGYGSAPGNAVATAISDPSGHFTLTMPSCSAAHEVWYIWGHGGNTGSGINSLSDLIAVLGPCNQAPSTVTVNEVTTVASTYAMSQFMNAKDPGLSHEIGAPSTNALGLVNAAGNVQSLVDLTTGTAPGPALPTGATAPTSLVNTLANILSSCVTANDANTAPCLQLECLATPGGVFTNPGCSQTVTAEGTLDAILQISRDPANNTTTLFALQPGSPPYTPDLGAKPNDWTVGLKYFKGLLNSPSGIAIDGFGNAWIANFNGRALTKLSPNGVALSPAAGFIGGGIAAAEFVAIDSGNNAWVTNENASISEFDSQGDPLSPSNGYVGGGLNSSFGIAIDGLDRVWVSNISASAISEFCGRLPGNCPAGVTTGQPISPSNGFTGGGLRNPPGIGVDGSGDVWAVSTQASPPDTLSEFTSAGVPVSVSGFTGGGLNHPTGVAFDTANNVWISNINNGPSAFSSAGTPLVGAPFNTGGAGNSLGVVVDSGNHVWVSNESSPIGRISEFDNTGTALSPSTGFQGGALNDPIGIAVDASGNVWAANDFDASVTQLLGAATPTRTPLIGLPVLP